MVLKKKQLIINGLDVCVWMEKIIPVLSQLLNVCDKVKHWESMQL